MLIEVSNHGPLLTATNFWESPLAERGLIFCSVNAGAIRVLLPPARYGDLNDMRPARYCILTRGPWPEQGKAEGIEIMWEDGTDAPYALHLTPESFDLLPAEPEPGREWVLTAWTAKDGRPHKSLERVCHWRRAARIPWLKPWEGV
jgi:hypothetical protein